MPRKQVAGRVEELEEIALPPEEIVVMYELMERPGVFTRVADDDQTVVSGEELAALEAQDRICLLKVVYDDADDQEETDG